MGCVARQSYLYCGAISPLLDSSTALTWGHHSSTFWAILALSASCYSSFSLGFSCSYPMRALCLPERLGHPRVCSTSGELFEFCRRIYFVLVVFLAVEIGFHLSVQQVTSLPLLVLLFQDWHGTAFNLSSQLDGPLWTLTVEWQFYLLLPLLALGLAKLAGRQSGPRQHWRLGVGLGLLILFGFAERGLAAFLHYGLSYSQPFEITGPLGWLLGLLYGAKGKYLEVFAVGMERVSYM